ncbi:MAG: radical SAM protein [Nitrososphaerota archaeon]
MLTRNAVITDAAKCMDCGFCREVNVCRSRNECSGCLSCYYACPYEAKKILEVMRPSKYVTIKIDGVKYAVPSGITLKEALKLSGFVFSEPWKKGIAVPCGIGGCWACAVIIDGALERTCITPVRDGMEVVLDVEKIEPLRIIHGPEPHLVGGKATPWWEVGRASYVEAAIWTAGCNLRCPQCQNWRITYDNSSGAVSPSEAARILAVCGKLYRTKGLAISGGEPTLNRRWLINFFKELKRLGSGFRLHLDSNGTILTQDYVDELVEAGCNTIGIEPKAGRLETYMKITGLKDVERAREYFERSWSAVKYVFEKYSESVYLGVGIAYNAAWMGFEELVEIGEIIASIDPRIQVTVLDYFPSFRRRSIRRPNHGEMLRVKKVLEDAGLKTVIVQTSIGHVGPS